MHIALRFKCHQERTWANLLADLQSLYVGQHTVPETPVVSLQPLHPPMHDTPYVQRNPAENQVIRHMSQKL